MTSGSHERPPRVAVIDDEEDVLTFLELAFQDCGWEVLAIDRPAEALRRVAAFAPDVICLDLLMPEQMGVSLYAELSSHRALRDTPVVVMSGLAARDGLASITASGDASPAPAAYIEKPIDIEVLMTTVQRALGDRLEVRK